MKKFLTLAITAALVLSLAGCNNNSGSADTTTTSAQAEATTTAPVEEATTTAEVAETTAEEETTTASEETAVPDEAEAKTIAEILLDRDGIISDVALKAGYNADYDAKIDITDGDMVWEFAPIIDDSCPFKSVADIKAFVSSTYTDAYDTFTSSSKYLYDNGYASMYIDYEGQFLMNVTGGGGGGTEWAYDTMTIASITADEIVGSCDGLTSYDEADHIDFVLKLDNGAWKIDSTASL